MANRKVKKEAQPRETHAENIVESLRPLRVPIASLATDPKNARKHPERNIEAVAASLRTYGQRKPIVVRREGMVVEAGNGTLEAAKRLGWASIAAVIVDDDPRTATGYALADNRTAELAEWDGDILRDLLVDLRDADFDLSSTGWTDRDINKMIGAVASGGEGHDPGAQDVPEKPSSVPGTIYHLGPHKLLCGSSTDAEAVARLMAGEKARLMATDPPYLVDYDGNNHAGITPAQRDRAARGATGGGKKWDDYNEASATLWEDFIRVALEHLEPDAPIYQWHASRRHGLVEAAWKATGLLYHQEIVWVKPHGVLTRCHYLWSHEPCMYGWREGHQPPLDRMPPSNASTVWQIGVEALDMKGIHPTQKPLEVCRWPIQWHTKKGELCYEPFGGSGTCIIAAAMEGRRCNAVELSPAFCDAIRKRWGAYARSAGIEPGSDAL